LPIIFRYANHHFHAIIFTLSFLPPIFSFRCLIFHRLRRHYFDAARRRIAAARAQHAQIKVQRHIANAMIAPDFADAAACSAARHC